MARGPLAEGRTFGRMRNVLCLCFVFSALSGAAQDSLLQFAFTSDVHYGITRQHFRGEDKVPATVVNRAMIAAIDALPGMALPADGGAGGGVRIGALDGILITGDIANREEKGIQSAAASWAQFEADYYRLVSTTDRHHAPTPILLGPGNHDVSNAIGFWRPSQPLRDASSMAGMYNRMLRPVHPVSASTYDYSADKIHYIRDMGGVELLFVNCWPDSLEQAWMEKKLALVAPGVPVLVFTHSNPDVEARFFTNPNGDHRIDSVDRFENLLPEVFRDGSSVKDSAVIEQRGFVAFLQRHPDIKAYFHGHSNYTQFYVWQGPDGKVSLPCFRVDSPMKGQLSSKDETLLAFEVITIDMHRRAMTVRECLWNTMPDQPAVLRWGRMKTMGL